MKLFHYSNADVTKLVPSVGARRHDGEDRRAVGRRVLWLSTVPMRMEPPREFEYVVEVDPGDPALFIDEPFARSIEAMGRRFGEDGLAMRFYWLEREIEPSSKKKWSPESRSYEPPP